MAQPEKVVPNDCSTQEKEIKGRFNRMVRRQGQIFKGYSATLWGKK